MTTVNPGAVVLSDAYNLTDAMAFKEAVVLEVATGKDGNVRAGANGRIRLFLSDTRRRTFNLQFELISRAQADWLEAHVGELVCVRDDRGRKVFGTYLEANVKELTLRSDYTDATIRVDEVTHPEVV